MNGRCAAGGSGRVSRIAIRDIDDSYATTTWSGSAHHVLDRLLWGQLSLLPAISEFEIVKVEISLFRNLKRDNSLPFIEMHDRK